MNNQIESLPELKQKLEEAYEQQNNDIANIKEKMTLLIKDKYPCVFTITTTDHAGYVKSMAHFATFARAEAVRDSNYKGLKIEATAPFLCLFTGKGKGAMGDEELRKVLEPMEEMLKVKEQENIETRNEIKTVKDKISAVYSQTYEHIFYVKAYRGESWSTKKLGIFSSFKTVSDMVTQFSNCAEFRPWVFTVGVEDSRNVDFNKYIFNQVPDFDPKTGYTDYGSS